MVLPLPHPGLVISYNYLWQDDDKQGREEGRKGRPCAIVLRRQILDDSMIVSVLPITHTPPIKPVDAFLLPDGLKRHLGLDDARSWIVLSEVNEFLMARIGSEPSPR